MKRCIIIYNPESGKKGKKIDVKALTERLKKYNYNVEFMATKKQGDAKEYIKKLEDIDLVICAGGDGTLNEVVSGNIEREKKILLSHLPIGTVTDVGKLYGFTKESMTDIDLIFQGKKKNIDVCLINNHPFLYVACFGKYMNVPYDTPRKLKTTFGRLGYFLYALKDIFKKIDKYKMKIEIDGHIEEGEYSYIFVTNTSRVGGFENLYDDVKLDDNMFEVIFCKVQSKLKMIKIFSTLGKKYIKDIPDLTYYRTNNLKIIFDEIPNSSWCIDGEELKHNTNVFEFKIDKSCNMLLPTTNLSKLFDNEKEDL